MGYSAKAVANYFLSNYGKHGISPLKLQKLVYVAHGWYMAFHEDPLIGDEYAEAWRHGPVFPSLYHEFKHRGSLRITELAKEVELVSGMLRRSTPGIPKSDVETRELLDKIWDVYGEYSAIQLSNMCHQAGSPWDQTRKSNPKNANNADIDDELIRKHYQRVRAKNRANRLRAEDQRKRG